MLLKMLEDHRSGLVWAGFTAIKSYLSANRIHYFHKSTVWCFHKTTVTISWSANRSLDPLLVSLVFTELDHPLLHSIVLATVSAAMAGSERGHESGSPFIHKLHSLPSDRWRLHTSRWKRVWKADCCSSTAVTWQLLGLL